MDKITSKVKSKAYLIIVTAFLIGIVTGSLLMNLVMANSAAVNAKKPSMINDLSSELQLSPEQRVKIEKIYADSRLAGKEILKTVEPRLAEVRAQTKASVKEVLGAEQQARYDQWCSRREAEKKKAAEEKK